MMFQVHTKFQMETYKLFTQEYQECIDCLTNMEYSQIPARVRLKVSAAPWLFCMGYGVIQRLKVSAAPAVWDIG